MRAAAQHRYRQSQMVGMTRAQLTALAESRRGRQQAAHAADVVAQAERSVEIAQTYVVPLYERVLM